MTWPRVAIVAVVSIAAHPHPLRAQTPPARHSARKFEIVDNSFLVEEAFNQEPHVVQNIFSWTFSRPGEWTGTVTQEWPLGSIAHQFSYTIPFARADGQAGIGDVQLNYRYQILQEGDRRPALAPRISVIVPTGSTAHGFGSGGAGLQVNVPFSKQFRDLYVHANAGSTWVPRGTLADGGRVSVTSPQLAASGIWRVSPMFNLMLESVVLFQITVQNGARAVDVRTVTISPGFRRGWNSGERQIVVGAALPITSGRTAFLTYFSLEAPFSR